MNNLRQGVLEKKKGAGNRHEQRVEDSWIGERG